MVYPIKGGLISHFNTTNGNGILSAPIDQESTWGCMGVYNSSASDASIGSGFAWSYCYYK
jgi:hypothetical protein